MEAGDRLRGDPAEPHGLRAAVDRYLTATTEALDCSDLVVVDLGDTNRAAWHARVSSRDATQSARRRALTRVDEFLGRLVGELDSDALLLVVGVRPPSRSWDLTPAVAYGAGVVPGSLHSPQTKREDLVTLTGVQALVYGVAAIALSQRAGRRVSSALRSPS